MKKIIPIIAFAVSSAFAQTPPGEPNPAAQEKIVKIIWHKTNDAWKECVRAYPGRADMLTAVGCFIMRGDICHIYAPDPASDQRYPNWTTNWWALGHETKHCFDGFFHP